LEDQPFVSVIHAAQITENPDCTYRFYGCGGKDLEGEFLLSSLQMTPLLTDQYQLSGKLNPFNRGTIRSGA